MGCFGGFKCASQPKIENNSLKDIFGGLKSFKVIDVGTPGKLVSRACYETQQVCVYLILSHVFKGYPNVMRSYGGLLERRGSKLAQLKSTLNAENFIRRLSWSISSDFEFRRRRVQYFLNIV